MTRQRLTALRSQWHRTKDSIAHAARSQARAIVHESIRRLRRQELQRALRYLLSPMAFAKEDPIAALQNPRTTIARIRDATREMVETKFGTEQAVLDFLRIVLEGLPDDVSEADLEELLRHDTMKRRQLASATPEGANLLSLYDSADEKGPLAPMLFILHHPSSRDPFDRLEAERALLAIQRSEGEARAQVLFDAVPALVEKVYGGYLRSVWSLSHLAEGAWPPVPPPNFGGLVAQTYKRVAHLPGLIDEDAGKLRNSVQHRQVDYLPKSNQVVFHNQPNPAAWKPNAWQLTLDLEDFESRLLRMHFISIDIMDRLRDMALFEFVQRSGMFRGLLALRSGLRRGDLNGVSYFDNRAIEKLLIRQTPPPNVNMWYFSMPLWPNESD